MKTTSEAPFYIPDSRQIFEDWWEVLTGNMSMSVYFSNTDRHLAWRAQYSMQEGWRAAKELEKGLEDPGVQVMLMQLGPIFSSRTIERQLEAGSIKLVNPGFPHLKGTTTNCINCAVAFDAVLAGRPASALPGSVDSIAVLETTYSAKFSAPTSIANIEATLLKAGDGARGIVFGEPTAGGVGHVVNVINQRGVVRFLDAQRGAVADFTGFKDFRLIRTN